MAHRYAPIVLITVLVLVVDEKRSKKTTEARMRNSFSSVVAPPNRHGQHN
jgi:hypothetical protein